MIGRFKTLVACLIAALIGFALVPFFYSFFMNHELFGDYKRIASFACSFALVVIFAYILSPEKEKKEVRDFLKCIMHLSGSEPRAQKESQKT